MRILVNGYIGKRLTGIGRSLLETIESASRIDLSNSFIIYTNFDNADFLNRQYSENVRIRAYPVSRTSPVKNLLFNTFVFPLLALRERADIVYISNFTLILYKLRPVVSVIHDMIDFRVAEKFSKIRLFYRRFAVPQMARMSNHIITVSENSKRDIEEICRVPSFKISVVYNAVSDDFCTSDCTNFRLINEEYMLYVGTVDYPGKNIHNAIKAFENYKLKCGSQLKFVICGMEGKGFDYVSALINRSKVNRDIVLFGYAAHNELSNLYLFAKLFIFISYYEGFGLPVLEAMKFGVPVITSNTSSLPEIAGDAAVICNPDDVCEIENAIRKILNDIEYADQLAEKGYRNLKRFSWENSAHKTIAVFEGCLNERKGLPSF